MKHSKFYTRIFWLIAISAWIVGINRLVEIRSFEWINNTELVLAIVIWTVLARAFPWAMKKILF